MPQGENGKRKWQNALQCRLKDSVKSPDEILVCHLHFQLEDFSKRVKTRKMIKANAVPSNLVS